MFKKITYLISSLALFILLASTSQAAKFYLEPASTKFNSNCEVAVNIMIDTEGVDSQGADALINFNPAEVTIVDQNSSILGTQVRLGNVYEFFPGNKVEGSKIYLTGASIMSPYNGSGLYGTIILKSIGSVASTTLSFDYTSGLTTDSNISDVSGAVDLLNSAKGGSYTFENVGYCGSDTVSPWVENENPADGSTGVALDSLVRFDVVDDSSGIDIDSLSVLLDGETYVSTDSELAYTAKNGGLRYSIVIDPRNTFMDETEVSVRVDVSDIATNSVRHTYSFNEPFLDNIGPKLTNAVPANGSKYDPSFNLISFHLTDNYSGVDDDTIKITVSSNGYTDVYKKGDTNITISGTQLTDRFIVIDPLHPFGEGIPVNVDAFAKDRRGNDGGGKYSFNYPISDTVPPYVRDLNIANNARVVLLSKNIFFSILDDISGVNIDTVKVQIDSVDGSYHEEFLKTDFANLAGDKARYDIEIDPTVDFPDGKEMVLTIYGEDLKANIRTHVIRFNRPSVCGDGVVEVDFGEQCDPPKDPFCTDTCQWGTCDEIIPACGNLYVDPGEECEPPNSIVCDDSCNYIIPVTLEQNFTVLSDVVTLTADEQVSFDSMIKDDDGDGLPNVMEDLYHTVSGSKDSDNDGYSDLEEIMDFGTDPNKFDSDINLSTRIIDPKDNYKTGSKNIFIRGVSHPGKNVRVFATSLEGIVYTLGDTLVTDDAKFVLLSTETLDEGEYLLTAEALEDDETQIDVSESVKIFISDKYFLAAPKVRSINDVLLKPGVKPKVYSPQPLVAGTTEPGVQVITVFESSIFSSTIIADGKTGFFTNFAPRPLEVGTHKVTVYALTSDGIMSDTSIVDFDIGDKQPLIASWVWWWILILVTLIFVSIISYFIYQRHKRKKEIYEQKELEKSIIDQQMQKQSDDSINWPKT